MEQSHSNHAVIAAAGSRKTEHVVDSALAITDESVLITTYTLENQRQITDRIRQKVGIQPDNITVMGWFAFLIGQCARPYQRAITGEPGVIRGLNFKGRRYYKTPRSRVGPFYFDRDLNMLRDGVSDFVYHLNEAAGGAVVGRLERVYRHIFIDEVQDLVGWDLDVIELLLRSSRSVTLVGDPRQQIIETNLGSKNKPYQGAGLLKWFEERDELCTVEVRNENWRSNQAICDFADSIFPALGTTVSKSQQTSDHEGIYLITEDKAWEYYEAHRPAVLRYSKTRDTLGLPHPRNIGVAKGSAFDHVMIFPTEAMRRFLDDGDADKLTSPEHLYVAVTRARHSVAFVVPS